MNERGEKSYTEAEVRTMMISRGKVYHKGPTETAAEAREALVWLAHHVEGVSLTDWNEKSGVIVSAIEMLHAWGLTVKLRGKSGGAARAKALSPERRKEIAEAAALARWGP